LRLRRREPDALAVIASTHGRRLFRAARGMGHDADAAEDLVQEVFVIFLQSLDRFEGRAQIGTWLFGILHRKSLERGRHDIRAEQHDAIDDVFDVQFDKRGHWAKPPRPDDVFVNSAAGSDISDCLKSLPAAQRAVFHYRQIEELSAVDVSKITGHSVTHIGVLLHRARIRLRACLEPKGWGPAR
jgi:RNA polymerase sigma factor (sigma-70 family)